MATVKDVRVKARLNILSSRIMDKSDDDQRPGKDGPQNKQIIDIPVLEIDSDELAQRIEHAQMVLEHGYWVDPDDIPPRVITGGVTALTHNSVVLHGHIKSGTDAIAATCGFKVGTTKALGSTKVADESPVMDAAIQAISYTWAGLTPETRYYYRVYATDVNFSGGKYGIVKSFKTDAAPV